VWRAEEFKRSGAELFLLCAAAFKTVWVSSKIIFATKKYCFIFAPVFALLQMLFEMLN
jgi:hypothetical protein